MKKAPRRIGLKKKLGHPVNLYFRLVERGKKIHFDKLPKIQKRTTFSHR